MTRDQYMLKHLLTINKNVVKKEHLDRFEDNQKEIGEVIGAQTINVVTSLVGKKGALAHFYISAAIGFMYHTMKLNNIDPENMLDYCCKSSVINKVGLLSIINNTTNKTNITVCLDNDMAKFIKIYYDDLEFAVQASNNTFGIEMYDSKWIKKILASLEVIIEKFVTNEEDKKVANMLKQILYSFLNYHMFEEFGTVKLERSKWESYLDLALVYSGAFCLGFVTTYLLTAMCCSALDGVMGGSIYAPSAGIQVAVNV